MLLTSLMQQCAPQVALATMSAIVRVESGGNPLAMWNNTTRSMVVPGSRLQAIAYLRQAMSAGDLVDVGLAQVDTENFAYLGLRPGNAFDVCTNLRAGSRILMADYRRATSVYGSGQSALFHAFEAYNSGRFRGDSEYADRILSAAGLPTASQRTASLPTASQKHVPLTIQVAWGDKKVGSKPVRTGAAYIVNW